MEASPAEEKDHNDDFGHCDIATTKCEPTCAMGRTLLSLRVTMKPGLGPVEEMFNFLFSLPVFLY